MPESGVLDYCMHTTLVACGIGVGVGRGANRGVSGEARAVDVAQALRQCQWYTLSMLVLLPLWCLVKCLHVPRSHSQSVAA